MNLFILIMVVLCLVFIAGAVCLYFVYRNNKKQMDEIICRYDKEMCEKKEDCGC